MKKQFLLFSLMAITFFSCQDDQNPEILLEGTYKATLQGDVGSSFTTMTFESDGSLSVERFVSIGNTEEVCLLNYQLGRYSLVNDEFVFTVNESYGPDPAANYMGCPGRAALIPQLDSQTLTVTGTLVLSNSKKQFNLNYQCPEELPYMCLGSEEFELSVP